MTIAFGAALSKTHLDADTDDPSQARAELEAIVVRINTKLANQTLLVTGDILDEDDFASDSATAPASQQSAKVYIDARSKVVGEVFAIQSDITGAAEPDNTGASGARFIELTAGLTGAGQYNENLLTGESTSGSSPNITATATISHAASPMDGQTVRLINTEERFLRAGNAGTTQGDQLGSHNHGGSTGTAGSHSHSRLNDASGNNDPLAQGDTGSGVAARIVSIGSGTDVASGDMIKTNSAGNHNHSVSSAGGDETRPRNVGITYYMRIA